MMLEDSMLASIVNVSLIGMGLISGLYAIIMQALNEISEKRLEKLGKLRAKRDVVLSKLNKDKENKDNVNKFTEIATEIDEMAEIPYHYNFGYLVSGMLFVIALVVSYVSLNFGIEVLGKFSGVVSYTPQILFLGILNFIYVWFRTMADLRNVTLSKFEIIAAENKELEDKSKEKIKNEED